MFGTWTVRSEVRAGRRGNWNSKRDYYIMLYYGLGALDKCFKQRRDM